MDTTIRNDTSRSSGFDETLFREALAKPRLRQPVPEFLPGNRSGDPVRVRTEDELRAMTSRWFVEFEARIAWYAARGIDIAWMLDWAKKYWWSWMMRDMSRNHELYTEDLRYLDPTTFGRTLVGLDEFVAYNFAFFEAIPDWRYDPLPGQVFLDLRPDGSAGIMIRYVGSGHFSGSLRFHPYDESAPTLHGAGTFVQCTAVDRYQFDASGRMYEGETLWDFIDATQSAGLLPAAESLTFRALLGASRVVRMARSVPFVGAD